MTIATHLPIFHDLCKSIQVVRQKRRSVVVRDDSGLLMFQNSPMSDYLKLEPAVPITRPAEKEGSAALRAPYDKVKQLKSKSQGPKDP